MRGAGGVGLKATPLRVWECVGYGLLNRLLCRLIHTSHRTYAIRRIRDAFRENKNVKDPVEIQALVNKAKRDLEIIRRQVHIGQLYSTDKLIIENQEKPRT
nr:PREDICTED: LYR motif-containing protein 4 [Camelus bactrianus]